jgi:hypothetical protein
VSPGGTAKTKWWSCGKCGGWNCRHSVHPFFEGSTTAYTQAQLAAYEEKKYTYNGKDLTEYEAMQQRYLERNIRKWKREYTALDAAGLDNTEAAVKLKAWREKETDFLRQTGRLRDSSRSQVGTFGRSEAGKATWAYRKNTLTDAGGNVIIKTARTLTTSTPNSITQITTAKGGITRNYYDSAGNWVKQISNNDHGFSDKHPFGNNGEHAHDIVWKDGKIVSRKARNLTEQERKDNGDIL